MPQLWLAIGDKNTYSEYISLAKFIEICIHSKGKEKVWHWQRLSLSRLKIRGLIAFSLAFCNLRLHCMRMNIFLPNWKRISPYTGKNINPYHILILCLAKFTLLFHTANE